MPSTTIITQSSQINLQLPNSKSLVGVPLEKSGNIPILNLHVKNLPYVVQLVILEYCMSDPILSDRWKLSLSLVSWSFHHVVSKLYHSLIFRDKDDLDHHLNSNYSVLKSIQSIYSIESSLSASKFNNIDLSNLAQLTIKSDIIPATLQLLPRITSLTSLSLLNPIDSSDNIILFLKQLQHSSNHNNPIEYLEIQNIMISNWQPIIDFLYNKRSSLRHVVLGIIDSVGLELLMKHLTPAVFGQLETIDVWGRGDMAAFGKHVSTFPKLRSLNLSKCIQFNSLEQSLLGNATITKLSLPQVQSPVEFIYKGQIEQWVSSMEQLSYLKLSPLYLMNNNNCSNNNSNITLNVKELELESFNSNSIDSNIQLQLSSASNIESLKMSFTGLERKYNKMLSTFIRESKTLKKLTIDYSDDLLETLSANTSITSLHFLNVPKSKLQNIMSNLQQNNNTIQSIFIPMHSLDNEPTDFNQFKYCPHSNSYYFYRNSSSCSEQ